MGVEIDVMMTSAHKRAILSLKKMKNLECIRTHLYPLHTHVHIHTYARACVRKIVYVVYVYIYKKIFIHRKRPKIRVIAFFWCSRKRRAVSQPLFLQEFSTFFDSLMPGLCTPGCQDGGLEDGRKGGGLRLFPRKRVKRGERYKEGRRRVKEGRNWIGCLTFSYHDVHEWKKSLLFAMSGHW